MLISFPHIAIAWLVAIVIATAPNPSYFLRAASDIGEAATQLPDLNLPAIEETLDHASSSLAESSRPLAELSPRYEPLTLRLGQVPPDFRATEKRVREFFQEKVATPAESEQYFKDLKLLLPFGARHLIFDEQVRQSLVYDIGTAMKEGSLKEHRILYEQGPDNPNDAELVPFKYNGMVLDVRTMKSLQSRMDRWRIEHPGLNDWFDSNAKQGIQGLFGTPILPDRSGSSLNDMDHPKIKLLALLAAPKRNRHKKQLTVATRLDQGLVRIKRPRINSSST